MEQIGAPLKSVSVESVPGKTSALTEQLAKTDLPLFDPQTTYGQLLRLSESNQSRNDYLLSLLQHAVSVSHAEGALFFVADNDGGLRLGPRLISRGLVHKIPDMMQSVDTLAKECCEKGYSVQVPLDQNKTVEIVLSPVSRSDNRKEVICLIFNNKSLASGHWGLFTQLLAGYVNLWEQNSANRYLMQESNFTGGLIEVVSNLNAATEKGRAYVELVAELSELSGADHVAIGLKNKGKSSFELVQLSGTDEVNKRGEFHRLLQLCFDESGSYGEVIQLPDTEIDWERNLFGGHQQFFNFCKARALLSLPLNLNNEDCLGVISFWWVESTPAPVFKNQIMAAGLPLANAVHALSRGRDYGGLLQRKKSGSGKLFALLLTAALIATMFIPVPHRITSNLLIQPVEQRIVSASFDAVLNNVVVDPGDVVSKGDLLAEFDGRELQWQLDALRADEARAKKEKDLKVAERDTQGAQLSRLEMDRIGLEIDLLESRIRNLQVVSPIDGIVISGDIERQQGSLIQKGNAIFEIAPLDQVNAEISISVDDFRHVDAELPVEIFVDALPDLSWETNLGKIQPRAIVADADTVFISRVNLDNGNKLLRPGMKGEASIVKEQRPLGWILFHKAYEQINMRFRTMFGWSIK